MFHVKISENLSLHFGHITFRGPCISPGSKFCPGLWKYYILALFVSNFNPLNTVRLIMWEVLLKSDKLRNLFVWRYSDILFDHHLIRKKAFIFNSSCSCPCHQLLFHQLLLSKQTQRKLLPVTVEPRSNGTATYRIPLVIDANWLSLQYVSLLRCDKAPL